MIHQSTIFIFEIKWTIFSSFVYNFLAHIHHSFMHENFLCISYFKYLIVCIFFYVFPSHHLKTFSNQPPDWLKIQVVFSIMEDVLMRFSVQRFNGNIFCLVCCRHWRLQVSAVRGARAAQGQPGAAHPQHAWPTGDGLLVQVIAKSCQHMRATWPNSGAIDSCDFWRGQCQKSVDFNSSAACRRRHAVACFCTGGSAQPRSIRRWFFHLDTFFTRALIFFHRAQRGAFRKPVISIAHDAISRLNAINQVPKSVPNSVTSLTRGNWRLFVCCCLC